jgi:hypothetical protein
MSAITHPTVIESPLHLPFKIHAVALGHGFMLGTTTAHNAPPMQHRPSHSGKFPAIALAEILDKSIAARRGLSMQNRKLSEPIARLDVELFRHRYTP